MRARLCRWLRAEPHELPALGWAFAYFFLLLCSYYILRPVRDALAVDAGFAGIAFVAAGVAVAWTALAFYLGARMKSWTRADAPSSSPWPPDPSLQKKRT